jgi:methylenetetrahydrofolate--tRNA-(uracil-5-)-methyltransferase
MKKTNAVHIVGGGLAGSECAYQLAARGHDVVLYEMRSHASTPAHKTDRLAELVCSNSLGSQTHYSAPGQLKWEAEELGSLILACAREASVPAGMALGVDRDVFAQLVTAAIGQHPRIKVERRVITSLAELPRPAVIASGPLTHPALAEDLRRHFDNSFLYFYDAIAPIIDADSIDTDIAFKADRWDKGNGDYFNCPLTRDQYFAFVEEIKAARKIEPKEFEKDFENTPYFESCMPIEAIIERGDMTLRFGPMSPSGIRHPRGEKPFAIVQLRQENREGSAYNMVGFQTKMAYPEQQRVFRLIPGLERAEFLKLGSIHRNMYVQTPKVLTPYLASRRDDGLFFAGQITGVEGYFDSTCIGLLVARFISDKLQGRRINLPPRSSALGSLLNAITEDRGHFQPTNINFGLFPLVPHVDGRQDKELKRGMQIHAAKAALTEWLRQQSAEIGSDRFLAL